MSDNNKSWIPQVSKEHILALSKRIKPVVRMERVREIVTKGKNWVEYTYQPDPKGKWHQTDKGELQYIEPVDLFGIAYTWDPKPIGQATDLKKISDITTYHTFGYHGMFKPSIAEVLAQIPSKQLDKVVAFEIIDSPKTRDDLFGKFNRETNAGYHVATTRLYSKS